MSGKEEWNSMFVCLFLMPTVVKHALIIKIIFHQQTSTLLKNCKSYSATVIKHSGI